MSSIFIFPYHLFICEFHFIPEKKKTDKDKQDPNHTTMLALKKEDGILLQTATGVVFSRENSNKKKNVRILFNKGSQKYFLNQSLGDELNLKTQRNENKILKPFEGKNKNMRKLDIVNVCFADTKSQNLTDIKLTVAPHICSTISGQTIELGQAMHEHLTDFPLADSTNGNSELAIDILTDRDLYWEIFSGMLRRGLRGPVEEENSLGWALSNCVGSSLGSSEFVSTHILKLSEAKYAETETTDSSIHEKDQVLLGIFKSTHLFIHEKVLDSLKIWRYAVQLPWKTDSLMLPDNFLPRKQRLISLLKRLKQKPELLNEYNEIISNKKKKV